MENRIIDFLKNRMGTANSIAVILVCGYVFCVVYLVVVTKDVEILADYKDNAATVMTALLVVKAVQTNTEK